jgi:hypothetical protein
MNMLYACIPLLCNCIFKTFKTGSRLSFVCISSKLLTPRAGLMGFPFFRFVNLLLSLISILKTEIQQTELLDWMILGINVDSLMHHMSGFPCMCLSITQLKYFVGRE